MAVQREADADREWCRLGARLLELCPDKFDEILDALRETVSAHELIALRNWAYRARGLARDDDAKA